MAFPVLTLSGNKRTDTLNNQALIVRGMVCVCARVCTCVIVAIFFSQMNKVLSLSTVYLRFVLPRHSSSVQKGAAAS